MAIATPSLTVYHFPDRDAILKHLNTNKFTKKIFFTEKKICSNDPRSYGRITYTVNDLFADLFSRQKINEFEVEKRVAIVLDHISRDPGEFIYIESQISAVIKRCALECRKGLSLPDMENERLVKSVLERSSSYS